MSCEHTMLLRQGYGIYTCMACYERVDLDDE
jgi:hypothetical protein